MVSKSKNSSLWMDRNKNAHIIKDVLIVLLISAVLLQLSLLFRVEKTIHAQRVAIFECGKIVQLIRNGP